MRDLIEALNRAHQLDNSRSLHEAAPQRVDAQGLQTNLPIVIKRILSRLPYNLQYKKLTGRINGREFNGRLSLIPGDSTHSVWKFNDESDNVTTIDLSFFWLPTNCDITAELLEDQYGKTILDAIQYNFVGSDKMSSRGDLHRSLEQRFINAIKPLETKYHVTLYPSFYPSQEEFQQHGGYIYAHVALTGVDGKSGQMQKQESGYYEYVVDGVSYSSYLRWRDHSIVAATIKEAEEFDFNVAVVKVENHLRELLPMIDKLDNIIANEPVAEKNMADFIANLTSKYPEATITLDRGHKGWPPRSFIVKYVEGPNHFEKTIAVEDVLNSFEKVKKGIQQKIYRTRKAPPQPSWMRSPSRGELNFESYNLSRSRKLAEASSNNNTNYIDEIFSFIQDYDGGSMWDEFVIEFEDVDDCDLDPSDIIEWMKNYPDMYDEFLTDEGEDDFTTSSHNSKTSNRIPFDFICKKLHMATVKDDYWGFVLGVWTPKKSDNIEDVARELYNALCSNNIEARVEYWVNHGPRYLGSKDVGTHLQLHKEKDGTYTVRDISFLNR